MTVILYLIFYIQKYFKAWKLSQFYHENNLSQQTTTVLAKTFLEFQTELTTSLLSTLEYHNQPKTPVITGLSAHFQDSRQPLSYGR